MSIPSGFEQVKSHSKSIDQIELNLNHCIVNLQPSQLMMNEDHRRLVACCIEVLDSYCPDSTAIEEHANTYLKSQQVLDDNDKTFVLEVFSGCVRYAGVLRVVLDGFFNRDGKHNLRSEENRYKVFAYLALFRLDELGVAHFRHFLRTQDINKMYKFLNFMFDDKNLQTWMKDEWGKQFEHSFVQTTLLSPIIRWQPELKEIVVHMKKKIENKIKPNIQHSTPTALKPFNITQPRPRSVPIPQPIPKLHRHRQVPDTTYVKPRAEEFMDHVRETNRRKAEERLMQASKIQFACANPGKTEKTLLKMRSILDVQEAELDFERHNAHPVPNSLLKDNISVKLNAAAILREGQLYKKREKEEQHKLERLEAGARDASDFLEWQSRMKKQDVDSQLADIERRRLEGKLSLEEAILARQDLINDNRRKVNEMKQEAARLMQVYLERRVEEEQEMRKLVEEVMDTHENAKEAKKKVQQYKAKIVQEMTEESREMMRQALDEAEKEMQQRMELIQQIRAMEAVPVIRQKLVDFSATAGHGLLSEMSITELRERVSLCKTAEQEEEDSRRDDILANKQAKDEILMETLEKISLHRVEQSKAAALRLEERKKQRHTKPQITDPKLEELKSRLQEKQQKRKQFQQQSKITPSDKSAQRLRELNASKKLLEESRWQELEQRQQRTAKLSSDRYMTNVSASRLAARATLIT